MRLSVLLGVYRCIRTIFIVLLIVTCMLASMLILSEMTHIGYDRVELDLTTGRSRYVYKQFGVPYRVTEPDREIAMTLWLARELQADEESDWVLMRYLNDSAPRINTKAGQLWSDIRFVGQHLQIAETEQSGRDLLASFIRQRMRSINANRQDGDREWAEMKYIFENLDVVTGPKSLRTRADVEEIIEAAIANAKH